MKLAHFRTNTILSGWSNLAIVQTLRGLGHTCYLGAIPTDWSGRVIFKLSEGQYRQIVASMPRFSELTECDAIIISGPEYIGAWLEQIYGLKNWKTLHCPVICLYMESSVRRDRSFDFTEARKWGTKHYYPDRRDAERFSGSVLPPAVDLSVFRYLPEIENQAIEQIDVGFVGSMYPLRQQFIEKLRPHLKGIELRTGYPMATDIHGELHRQWVENYVKSINYLKIHFCLPSNNDGFDVGRIYETLACGTFCMAPWPIMKKTAFLASAQHLVRYIPEEPESCAGLIRHYLNEPTERQLIASIGHEFVKKNCDLRIVLQQIIKECL